MTLSGTGLQQFTFNWAGVDYIAITGGSGYYINDIQVNQPVVAAVPEPSTWAMMLLGFAGLGFAFHRSRRKLAAA